MNRIILRGPSLLLKPTITQVLADYQLEQSREPEVVYGVPASEYQAEVKFKPHVSLWFKQDEIEVKAGESRSKGEISFRLMTETSKSLTPEKIQTLAQKIKNKFGGSTPFTWAKGKTYYTYYDKEKGYQFKILTNGEPEARRIIESVLDIQGHSPQWEKLGLSGKVQPDQAFPAIPDKEVILGKSRTLPRRRPVTTVKFRRASLIIWGLTKPIHLVSESNLLQSPPS